MKIYRFFISRQTNQTEMLDLLWTFTPIQSRMILNRQLTRVPSLQSLARDIVMLTIFTNNSQERQVRPLVDRLGANITRPAREMLLIPYSKRVRCTGISL